MELQRMMLCHDGCAMRERKFQKNDAVEINEKVVGPKRVYIGQPGTVYGLNGSWVCVKLAGKTDPVPFRPKWLD
jgi:hypothetical protein